jgi:lipoprotein-anchoring transpeptidase ErfK/SrfK
MALVCMTGLAACGDGGGPSDLNLPSTPTTAPKATTTIGAAAPTPPVGSPEPDLPDYVSLVAVSRVPRLAVFKSPDAARPAREIANPWYATANDPSTKIEQVFLVDTRQGNGWLKVQLPVSPNGATGWIRESDVHINKVGYKLKVELDARLITVFHRGDKIYEGPVAVGAPRSPTPTGRYFLRGVLAVPNGAPRLFGRYALGLASRTNALATSLGADDEVGIHGNNDPSALGRAVTLGSIRMENAEIAELATLLPLGTPVEIVN